LKIDRGERNYKLENGDSWRFHHVVGLVEREKLESEKEKEEEDKVCVFEV